jgi:hypothetical protein
MRYNVLTSLSRFQNIPQIHQMLEREGCAWHIVIDQDWGFELRFEDPWVTVYYCPTPPGPFWLRCHAALNWLLDNMVIDPYDRYSFLNDDDFYEPGFIQKLDPFNGPVVVTSMKRGNRTPEDVDPLRAHSTSPLIANPESMKEGLVGLEQIFMTGEVIKKVRIPLHPCGDGEMIRWVTSNYPVEYAPDAFVWFNYLEPGRWA